MEVKTKFQVIVHYVAAEEPFKDKAANPTETVGELKARVLAAFGLSEGSTPDGNSATYTLHHHKTVLDNLNQTLEEIAGDQPVLQLQLVQQIVQG